MNKIKDVRSLQFLDTYFPTVDGVVQTVHNYASIMNDISYSGVVTPSAAVKYDDASLPYEVIRTGALKIPFWEYSYAVPRFSVGLKKQIISKKPDILHSHSPFATGSYAYSLSRELGIPCVATFHSKYYDDTLRLTGSKAAASIVVKHIVSLYNKYDSVWSVSDGTAETLRSYGYKGDIFVVPNGTAFKVPDDTQSLKKEARDIFSIPDDKKIILFVGHLIWQKNLKLVLDTFKLLSEKSDDYRLIIVGNGYGEKQIRSYSEKLHFREGNVRFLGKVTDRRLLSGIFSCGDLFFFPSVYDNAPLVVREAAAMGLPSLLTAGSNSAECVVKDMSGFTAREDAESMMSEIERIFNTEGLLSRVSKAARETIPIPWEKIAYSVMEKYREIIEEKSRDPKRAFDTARR